MRRLPLALALAGALLLVVSTSASARPLEIKPVSFTDQVGDAGTAPDVSAVSVTNDVNGTYTIDVTFATPLTPSSFVDLFLDTDLNASTGDPQSAGADFAIEDDESTQSFGFYKWGGSPATFVSISSAAIHVRSSQDLKGLEFQVGTPDIGAGTGFNFFVESADADGSTGHYDDAPSGTAVWQYKLQQQVTLSFLAAKATAVKAGGTWVLALAAKRSDTGATLGGEGTIVCKATSGTTHLVLVTHAFISASGSNAAVCAFKVPKKLKHKLLHGTMTVSYEGSSVTHSFTTKAG
jgi:hypothetical protein